MNNIGPSDKIILYWNERLIPNILEDDEQFLFHNVLKIKSPHSLPCQGKKLFINCITEWRSILEYIHLEQDFNNFMLTISDPIKPSERIFPIQVFDTTAKLYNNEKVEQGQNLNMELFLLLHITLLYMRDGFLNPLTDFLSKYYENDKRYPYLSWINSLFGSNKLWETRPCNKLWNLRHAVAHGNWSFDKKNLNLIYFAKKDIKSNEYNRFELPVNLVLSLLRLYLRYALFQMGMFEEYCFNKLK